MSSNSNRTMSVEEVALSISPSVWVINTSENISTEGDKADVFIYVMHNNQSLSVFIPKSWLPVNLATRLPKKVLLDSANFLDALYKGLIALITPEYAQELESRPGAETERRRLRELDAKLREASKAKGINVELTDRTQDSQRTLDVTDLGAEPEDGVTPAFRAVVANLNGLPEEEAVNELRMRGKLNAKNARYLLAHIKHPSIVAFLRKSLGLESPQHEEGVSSTDA